MTFNGLHGAITQKTELFDLFNISLSAISKESLKKNLVDVPFLHSWE
jgi:hypothetical protein